MTYVPTTEDHFHYPKEIPSLTLLHFLKITNWLSVFLKLWPTLDTFSADYCIVNGLYALFPSLCRLSRFNCGTAWISISFCFLGRWSPTIWIDYFLERSLLSWMPGKTQLTQCTACSPECFRLSLDSRASFRWDMLRGDKHWACSDCIGSPCRVHQSTHLLPHSYWLGRRVVSPYVLLGTSS